MNLARIALAALALGLLLAEPLAAQTTTPTVTDRKTAATCPLSPAPNTLWSLAQCCSHDLHSRRPSCRVYDAKDEYVIIKDNAPTKPDAYRIIPTVKVTGIEDPRILESPFVDFWEYSGSVRSNIRASRRRASGWPSTPSTVAARTSSTSTSRALGPT
jgi:CDP-diacylglycerol pyrophosphatase